MENSEFGEWGGSTDDNGGHFGWKLDPEWDTVEKSTTSSPLFSTAFQDESAAGINPDLPAAMSAAATVANESEAYDYDLDESATTFFLEEVVPTAIVYGITFFVGIVGNTLIIFTIFKHRKMRTITNVFLASLATADLLLITACVPVKMAKLFSYSWTFGEFLCKFVHYIQNVSAICSVLTMTSMSLERYYAILHPMKAKYICTISQARKVILVIWILSFAFATPILLVQVHLEVGQRVKAYWCIHDSSATQLWRFYVVYMLVLILVIPATIMGFAYISICLEVWNVMKMRATMIGGETNTHNGSEPGHEMHTLTVTSNGPRHHTYRTKRSGLKADEDNSTVKQVIKMLVAVVLLFIGCWTPLLVTEVLTAFGHLQQLNYGYLKPMRTAFHLMAYFNSCVNPIVYGFMSRNFRDSFVKALACLVCGRHGGRRGLHAHNPSTRRSISGTHATRTTSVSLGRSLSVSTNNTNY